MKFFFHVRHQPCLAGFICFGVFNLLFSACSTSESLEISRRFEQIQVLFDQAKTPDQYLQAAQQYQEIIDSGFTNGAIFYNLGNAFLKAGKRGHAIAAYRQARRYLARFPKLDANLASAYGPNRIEADAQEKLIDRFLFWKDWLSYPEKCYLTVLAAALAALFAIAKLFFNRSGVLKKLLLCSLILFLLLLISAAHDFYRYEVSDQGVIIGNEVVARKGDSESYKPAFSDTLKETTEFMVREKRGEWLLIRLQNGPEGWIPAKEAVVF